ncbi:Putative ribonuclease H protein At1g65750 [Linum perenne]
MKEESQLGRVSHLLYADDAMLFCDATEDQVRIVVATLICFECITGLKVNLHKSSLFPVGFVPNIRVFADIVGCKVEAFPTSYLGLPLGARSFSKEIWDPVFANLERKVSSWKARFLSFGGRIALLKSVLSGLPIYFMSLFKAPATVIRRLENLQCRFLWAGDLQKDKVHWIAWESVKAPRCFGGLGIQDMKILNAALLSKWAWRFAVERNAWWRNLLATKCGIGRSVWQSCWDEGPAVCSIWRWIVTFNPIFWRHDFLDPGGGLCDFWFDYWVGGVRLCEAYPRIAAAAQSLESCVHDLCYFDSGWKWNIPLTTTLRGGALSEWNHLMDRLEALPEQHITTGPAFVRWRLESTRCFSVGSLRRVLISERFRAVPEFPEIAVWKKEVPTKIQGFVWMVWHGKIASIDNLQKRGMVLVNWCALCERDLESINHLFIHCSFTSSVWGRVSSKLSLYGPRNAGVRDLIEAWKGMNSTSTFPVAPRVLLHGVFWFIWLERNARIFNDVRLSDKRVADQILCNIGRWLRVAGLFSTMDLSRWFAFLFDPG